ncbi:Qa-SNARE protein, putative [Plasmodium berghei]|uniref:Qa-SNARE protein, putative n=2 Tax=Plasmodium berghei TaxID=5821 RepID=A0A509AQF8_PLABA|nr:Qa-SNARE protein, putative [Plasmodium berghei ANKA]CXI99251.1 Qa-SNARE protein, putative [Plasmodium berghei]SCL97843.1 Qa-SNARE protein, putative [Plasmodium berghei]SCM16693.1 Qa-SNARE protein, putative [Plasmodium berghei]SCM18491.1 Qa-SNARE protein, putative [Plasmodium berghei]SCN27924.1 Qa-SNARE protein, putative [Plasmodium berghei]|eukprot:XP_034423576.1 Qa-SNARE protein, putative [Plasmodium berghei ANKA]
MDRYNDFIYLCKKYDNNVNFIRRDIKCKDNFLVKSSEIYTKIFSNRDYIDNSTLKTYGLLFVSSKYEEITKKSRVKNKDNLSYSINRISNEIKNLQPKTDIHKYVLNCLTNLLSIFVDILNKYEQNLSSYHVKLNKYTNFYFYDTNNIKCNLSYLNTLNNYIYSSHASDTQLKKNGNDDFDENFKISSLNVNTSQGMGYKETEKILNYDKKYTNDINYLNKDQNIKKDVNYYDRNNVFSKPEKNPSYNKEPTNNIFEHNLKTNLIKNIDNNDNMNNNLRNRKKNQIIYNTFILEEEEKEKKKNENQFNEGYELNNNQKLEFKKFVDLFEKEENTYIMETKNKIAKINNLMNIFVNKIYEQNENLKMIEHIVEESIENVSKGNTYLTKIKNKKSMNSLIFFILIFTSVFLFIFDFFR